jgi:hypothetical protein
MPDEFEDQAGEQGSVPSANLGASKSGKVQGLVDILVRDFQKVDHKKSGYDSLIGRPVHDIPQSDLKLYEAWLDEAYSYFRKASHQKLSLTYASEWMLDNYYVIQQALKQIKEDLPLNYYRQLPKLAEGSLKDFPRIYAIASAVIAFQNHFDPISRTGAIDHGRIVGVAYFSALWADRRFGAHFGFDHSTPRSTPHSGDEFAVAWD